MKRELFIHLSFWFAFFIFVSIFKNLFSLNYWPLWAGGLLGVILPDLDHLIYVFFLSPQDLTSQRVGFLLKRREIKRTISLLYETRDERKGLIFHTSIFQIVFLILTFLIVSSSTSSFGVGLVLSFSLHLVVDQLIDLVSTKNLNNWGNILPIELDFKKSQIYLIAVFIIICVMGFLM